MKYIFISLLLLSSLLAFSQEKPKTNQREKQAKQTQVDDGLAEMMSGDFIYRPQGRRDPFWDLLKGKNVKHTREVIEGIQGLMIDELDLEGISQQNGIYYALVKDPKNKPYVITVGEIVYDGEVVHIDSKSVTFKKILTVALGGKKEKEIVKRINPDEEEKQK
jgi:Tfp pilus assembly protein PilP